MAEDRHDFVEIGVYKREPELLCRPAERVQRSHNMLSRVLNMETTIAFTGAGCSASLGYLTWKEFAAGTLQLTIAEAEARRERSDLDARIERLNGFKQQLGPDPEITVKPEQLLVILGLCRETLKAVGADTNYYKFLHDTFAKPSKRAGTHNPYDDLLELPIRRFMTSNYDGELEQSLIRMRGISPDRFGLNRNIPRTDGRQLDFTQQAEYVEQLAVFVLARARQADDMVFHCHGHYNHPDSMIVTESDYQRWYLAKDFRSVTAFQQTIEILLSSNPILFVGYGLGDDDLLRPLRMLTAMGPERKHSRPIFAILYEETPGRDRDTHEFLYERYGLHVIPYSSPPDPESRAEALCELLRSIKEGQGKWWAGWIKKPYFRQVEMPVEPPSPYRQYPAADKTIEVYGKERLGKILSELQESANSEARVIALVGPGGTGKSWCAAQLLEKLQQTNVSEGRDTRFEGFFFWSSHYADDSLIGLDTVLAYLDKKEGGTDGAMVSRLERLKAHLRRGKYFLVFDGIERFLIQTDDPEEGVGCKPRITEFLEVMMSEENQSTIVLTSRLWPLVFGRGGSRIRRNKLPPFTAHDIKDVPPFSLVYQSQLSSLCALLKGHAYALVLAAALIRRAGIAAEAAGKAAEDGAVECLSRLLATLAGASEDGYIPRMIRESIRSLDETWKGLALKVLERISVFIRPVPRLTIERCFDLALADMPSDGNKSAGRQVDLMSALLSSKLVQEVDADPCDLDRVAYTVHPIVRGYIYVNVHKASTDAAPNFILGGFTAATASVDPGGNAGVRVVEDLYNRLCDDSETAWSKGRESEMAKSRTLCRGAFSVLRSRMEVLRARWRLFMQMRWPGFIMSLAWLVMPKETCLIPSRFGNGGWR